MADQARPSQQQATTPIEIDGGTGEGGGQVVRVAAALAAVTSRPLRITHIRANRPRGGGLKMQHVRALRWLAEVTGAETGPGSGIEVGSQTVEFAPRLSPSEALRREEGGGERKFTLRLRGGGASSALLVFQAVLPFVLFAGDENNTPVELTIEGGTNVPFSPSYEYVSQVLLETLRDAFGIVVEGRLERRGWATPGGRDEDKEAQKGRVWFRIHPLPLGATLKPTRAGPWDHNKANTEEDFRIIQIHVSIVAPRAMHGPMRRALADELSIIFPGVEVVFVVLEDSGQDVRKRYVLLVARSATNLRWGRDCDINAKGEGKGVRQEAKQDPAALCARMAQKVSRELFDETRVRGVVDKYLQDQLVVFQTLAEGRTSFARDSPEDVAETKSSRTGKKVPKGGGLQTAMEALHIDPGEKEDEVTGPFGQGSTHATTARWVSHELMPGVRWYDDGRVCEGAGVSFLAAEPSETVLGVRQPGASAGAAQAEPVGSGPPGEGTQ